MFNHEAASLEQFDRVNNELYEVSRHAHAYASILGPIMGNIGNVLYVVLALAGGVFLLAGVSNFSLSGLPFSIWMTLILILGIVAMFFVTKIIGGGTAEYFMRTTGSALRPMSIPGNGPGVIPIQTAL